MWLLIVGIIFGAGAGFFIRDRTRPVRTITAPDVAAIGVVSDSETEIKVLLDVLPMGVVVLLPDGQERFRNTVAMSIAGARHADVLIEAAAERLLVLALRGLESREQIQLAGPPPRVIEVRAIPLTDGGAIAIMDDVTERWRIDQVRTDFVANVSHELKTPVGAISVLAETIEGETEDELVLRLTGRMVIEAQRMSRTIDDLLELSRIELGGEMLMVDIDLADVAAEAIERVSPIAMRKGVPLLLKSEKGIAIVSGDFFQLVSAVKNLVENAVKYSEQTRQVDVRVVATDTTVSLEVEDRGIGIPADSIDRIFERFYRVDRARNRATGGTGLGLSIVRHIATNHGGEVNVRSREGEGSTFILQIPRVLRSV
jgi:two-component system, OmpR family, sensor histidine kinase SenX3